LLCNYSFGDDVVQLTKGLKESSDQPSQLNLTKLKS